MMDYVAQFMDWVGARINDRGLSRHTIDHLYAEWRALAFPDEWRELDVGRGCVVDPRPSSSDPRKAQTMQGLRLAIAHHNKKTGQVLRVERLGSDLVVTRIR